MQETQIWSLGWEDSLEKEMATLSSFLLGKSHGQRSLVSYSPRGHKESDMIKWLSTHTHLNNINITQKRKLHELFCFSLQIKVIFRGFLGGSVVKNPSPSAGDTGSVPDPGRSHLPWSNCACAPQVPKPACPRVQVPQQETPAQREAHIAQLESSPCSLQRKKHPCSSEDLAQPKQTNTVF